MGVPVVTGAGERAQVGVYFQFPPLLLLLAVPHVAVWFVFCNGVGNL